MTAPNPLETLDQLSLSDGFDFMLKSQARALEAVQSAKANLIEAAKQAAQILANGQGRILYAGAGTSARIGTQDGAELAPTFGWPKSRLGFLIAGGPEALLHAREGAEDCEQDAKDLCNSLQIDQSDVLVLLAASGATPYTLAVANAGKNAGALTIGIANLADSRLLQSVDIPVCLETGPEALNGSTRLAAGTAQKIALNIWSTAVMVRLGHVRDGLMIDMTPTNHKLQKRAIGIVAALANRSEAEAEQSLIEVGWVIRKAVARFDNAVNLKR